VVDAKKLGVDSRDEGNCLLVTTIARGEQSPGQGLGLAMMVTWSVLILDRRQFVL